MKHNVGIWIDHHKAVIVSASASRVMVKTLQSEIGPPQGRGGEKTSEQRDAQQLDRYYDEIISQLGQPAALVIFGPGEAKLQLKARLSASDALRDQSIDIETTDQMTDPQIVAKVKDHYGIERRDDGIGPPHGPKPH